MLTGYGLCSQLTDFRDGVIRVHAPQHAKVSMAILLDSKTKARDVMARFDYENGSVKHCRDNDYHGDVVTIAMQCEVLQ